MAREVRKADPTGVGDAFRAGFLTGLAGAWTTGAAPSSARCWRPTSSRRSAPRSTTLGQARFLQRLAEAYGAGVGRRDRAAPRLRRAPEPRRHAASSLPPSALAARPWTRADAGEDLVGVGADLAPGTLLAAYRTGLFPMGLGAGRRRRRSGWWSPDPRGVLLPGGLRVSRSLRKALPHVRDARRHRVRARSSRRAPTRAGTAAGSPPRSPTPTPSCTRSAGRTRVETWQDGELVGGLYGLAVGGLFAGESMFHHATDASKVALVALAELVFADGDPRRLIDVQWATAAPGEPGRPRGAARRLLPPPRGGAGAAPAEPWRAGRSRPSPRPERLRRADDHVRTAGTPTRRGSTSSATVRSSWPRIRHHAGTS